MKKRVSLGKKSVLVILFLALVLTAAAVLNSYRLYAGTMDKHYQMLAIDVARTAAELVDSDWVKSTGMRWTQSIPEIPPLNIKMKRSGQHISGSMTH